MTSEPDVPDRGGAPSSRHRAAAVPAREPGPPAHDRPAHDRPAQDRPAQDPPTHDPSAHDSPSGAPDAGYRTRRPWSARRLPTALVATVVLVAAGAALIDVVLVRAGRPAALWRRRLADELADRPVDDVWVLAGAAAAVALGVWLIVLALTPGLRHWLPLRSPEPGLRASLDRDGAADLLRDAAMRVPGVGAARVRVRRRRAKARADVHFRDPRQVKDDLTTVLDEERDRMALARPPRIVVRVRRRTR